jgi:cytidylate kinase
MPIITISRGSYSRGKEVAEKLAHKLNYECISREIILEACAEFNIPEIKLIRALHDAPTVLERFQHGKDRYLSYFRNSLLKHVQKDNVVYHGLAGQYILRDIPHVFKIRIISDMSHRIQEEMKRTGILEREARFVLKKDDEERRKWGLQVYGTDTWDSRLYDMVLHINSLSIDDAVQILYETAQKPQFQATEKSQNTLDRMLKRAHIHSMLVEFSAHVQVVLDESRVVISNIREDQKEKIEKLVMKLDGITSVTFGEPFVAKTNYINPFHNI